MAAAPRPAATLLLLLLLLPPPPASGNVGGAAGVCKCQRLRQPPKEPPVLAREVLSYQACPGHLVRFQLPHGQICGLKTVPWVIQLQELWEQKEAARIDASRGEKGSGPALNPPTALLPPNAKPPVLSTARPTVPHGPTDGPSEPHRPTDGPLVPYGSTDRPPEPHGPTDGAPEPHGPTDRPPELHGPTARPTDGALPSDPVGGPSVAPRQGAGAGDGAPPTQPSPAPTAVLALLGIALVLVGAMTYLLCRRRRAGQCGGASRAPPQGPCSAHRDPGRGTLYQPAELG